MVLDEDFGVEVVTRFSGKSARFSGKGLNNDVVKDHDEAD